MFGDGQILFLWAFWCDVDHPSLILLCHFFFEREDTRSCAYLYGGLFRCQTSELLDTFFLLLHISCFSSCAANSLVVNFHKKFSLNWIQAILTLKFIRGFGCTCCQHKLLLMFFLSLLLMVFVAFPVVLWTSMVWWFSMYYTLAYYFFLNYTTLALLEEKKITFVP